MPGGRFSDGFLTGIIVGAAGFFLLGTEKGKKILKAISEEGGPELSKFLKELEMRNAGAKPAPKPSSAKSSQISKNSNSEDLSHEDSPPSNGVSNGEHSSSKPRRFFKKSK